MQAGDVAELARGGVVARQQHAGGAGQLARLLDDRAVDRVEVDRGGDRLQRAVEQPLLAAQAGLALEQLGALEGQRGEPGEDLDRAQVLGAERPQRRVGGDREDAERAPAGGAHRRGDEGGGRIELPREVRERLVEVVRQPLAQALGAGPVGDARDQHGGAGLDRRLGDAAALGVVGTGEQRVERARGVLAREPGGGGADRGAILVDGHEGHAGDVEQRADLCDQLLERVMEPTLCDGPLGHPRRATLTDRRHTGARLAGEEVARRATGEGAQMSELATPSR